MKIKINIKELKEDINLFLWENNFHTDYLLACNELLGGIDNVEVNIK